MCLLKNTKRYQPIESQVNSKYLLVNTNLLWQTDNSYILFSLSFFPCGGGGSIICKGKQ